MRLGVTLDCRDGVHGGCETCDCSCHDAGLESTLMCMHEWHEPNQAVDDFHHCTRTAEHTGPHTCGWCQDLQRA